MPTLIRKNQLKNPAGEYLYSDLKSVSGMSNGDTKIVSGRNIIDDGGGGVFVWDDTDFSITNPLNVYDPEQGLYVIPDGLSADGSDGAWVRQGIEDTVDVRYFGAIAGEFDSTVAIQGATSTGKNILISDFYKTNTITAQKAKFIGIGKDKSGLELHTDDAKDMFVIDNLTLENLTLSDGGRSLIDHTQEANATLLRCTNYFKSKDVFYNVDRNILSQIATADDSLTDVKNCTISRVNDPIAGEEDGMNLFVISGVIKINFDSCIFKNIVGRSIINGTYVHSVAGIVAPTIATITNCTVDLFRNSGTGSEVKTFFLQGYLSTIRSNVFIDCFGRHIDILGNYDNAQNFDVIKMSTIAGNEVRYTTTNQSIAGSDNEEAGSIYTRYADIAIQNNVLDFSNLLLVASVYNGIAVRHGYKSSLIDNNVIVSPKGRGIAVDISDLIDVESSTISIINNDVLKATVASRSPIEINNNSAIKVFSNVVVEKNTLDYSQTRGDIYIGSSPARASSFSIQNLTIKNNWNPTLEQLDNVNFQTFPEYLNGDIDVVIEVDPNGDNSNGIITSFADAFTCTSNYNCKKLTIKLADSVTTEQTTTAVLEPIPKSTVIQGSNGFGGIIRFFRTATNQTNVSITLNHNKIEFIGCKLESEDLPTNTIAHAVLFGNGYCLFSNCEINNGEYAVDSRGPDFEVIGGTINRINKGNSGQRSIIRVSSDTLVNASLLNVSGADNTRLYNLVSPAIFSYDNLSLGVEDGIGAINIPIVDTSSVSIYAVEALTNIVVQDGVAFFTIPSKLNTSNLVSVHARVITAGTTGTTDIQVFNVTQSVNMLSTVLTIDSGETGSDTATTPAVIDTNNDDVATNDLIRIDVTSVSTTAPKGLIVTLEFK